MKETEIPITKGNKPIYKGMVLTIWNSGQGKTIVIVKKIGSCQGLCGKGERGKLAKHKEILGQ